VEGSDIKNTVEKTIPTKTKKSTVKTKKKPVKKQAESKTVTKESEEKTEPVVSKSTTTSAPDMRGLNFFGDQAKDFASRNGFSNQYCFLIDMSIPSGRNRFFVYDLQNQSIYMSALVAHGCCNETFISRPKFSNSSNSGCSSLGKYKVGELYNGKYGKSFRLYGLDNSNSNAFKRGVVIHAYDCVPDKEIYPQVLCNSLGCPMVSFSFFKKLTNMIQKSDKPILLWIYQ
jgi:hypothetical protein